jgi:prolyl 4-hydroxylase
MELIQYPEDIMVITDFLDSEECESIIKRADAMGYEEAPINTLSGAEVFKDLRNNNRVMFDDFDLAGELFRKIRQFLPQEVDGCSLYNLNERFRIYRYEREQYFKWHRDGSFMREYTEISKITFMIYLNEGFSGGTTDFVYCNITPSRGSALLFPHLTRHQGAPVKRGVKYVLRTDVMYKF